MRAGQRVGCPKTQRHLLHLGACGHRRRAAAGGGQSFAGPSTALQPCSRLLLPSLQPLRQPPRLPIPRAAAATRRSRERSAVCRSGGGGAYWQGSAAEARPRRRLIDHVDGGVREAAVWDVLLRSAYRCNSGTAPSQQGQTMQRM
jgi:hypothetical protein